MIVGAAILGGCAGAALAHAIGMTLTAPMEPWQLIAMSLVGAGIGVVMAST